MRDLLYILALGMTLAMMLWADFWRDQARKDLAKEKERSRSLESCLFEAREETARLRCLLACLDEDQRRVVEARAKKEGGILL